MRLWKQNLTDDGQGSILRHGRARLYFGEASVGASWNFGRQLRTVGLLVEVDDYDDDLGASLHLRWLHLWLHIDGFRWSRWLHKRLQGSEYPYGRQISVKAHGGAIFWCLWRDDGYWTRGDWRHGSWSWLRTLQGKPVHTRETVEQHRTVIPMPEGTYPATVTIERATWQYPRWPTKRAYRTEVVPDRPVPVPGKGENSWDCGDDAIHSQHSGHRTVWGAVGSFVESVYRDRLRYGGRVDWTPSKAA